MGISGPGQRDDSRVSSACQRRVSGEVHCSSLNTSTKLRHETYPVRFSVDYPDRALNKTTTAFRAFAAIPILTVLAAISGGTWQWTRDNASTPAVIGAGGPLCLGPLLMIVFRQEYPRWWFDFNLELQRFPNRVWVYLALIDDRYPSTTDQQSVLTRYARTGDDVVRAAGSNDWRACGERLTLAKK